MFLRSVESGRLFRRCKPVHRPRLAAGALLLIALAGCSHQTRPAHGGFLTDYAQLQQAKDAQGHTYFVHRFTTPATDARRQCAVSVEYFPAAVRFNGLGSETQANILAYLDRAIRQQLQKNALLAGDSEQPDIRLRVAITAVAASDPGMKPWDFLPFRLLTKPIKDGVLGAPKVASATLEVQAVDARTGAVLSESVRADNGKSIGREKHGVSVVTFESLRAVLDQWALSVASGQVPGAR